MARSLLASKSKSLPLINGRFLAKPNSGVSRVGIELLRALSDALTERRSLTRVRVAVPQSTVLSDFASSETLAPTRGFSSNLGVQLALPILYRGATVLSFCNETPLLATRSVLWIHDTNIFDAPDSYPLSYKVWHRVLLEAAKLRRFDVVTVSAHSRARLIARGIAPDKVRVIYNGGDHILREPEDPRILAAVGLHDREYILLVGSPARHKNLPFAIQELLPRCNPSLRLAVLGLSQAGPYTDAGGYVNSPNLTILPRVNDGQLRSLYRSARAVVSPSLCEGFGLYAAEAMFADAGPLVLSNCGALPEVGGSAALYFDPLDPASLRSALDQALRPESVQRMASAARIQRENFRWSNAAREVIERYIA
jgi:glycosyltransferase involved in cell wall biosynthesis